MQYRGSRTTELNVEKKRSKPRPRSQVGTLSFVMIMMYQGDKLETDVRVGGEGGGGSEEPRRKTSFIEQLGSLLKNIL